MNNELLAPYFELEEVAAIQQWRGEIFIDEKLAEQIESLPDEEKGNDTPINVNLNGQSIVLFRKEIYIARLLREKTFSDLGLELGVPVGSCRIGNLQTYPKNELYGCAYSLSIGRGLEYGTAIRGKKRGFEEKYFARNQRAFTAMACFNGYAAAPHNASHERDIIYMPHDSVYFVDFDLYDGQSGISSFDYHYDRLFRSIMLDPDKNDDITPHPPCFDTRDAFIERVKASDPRATIFAVRDALLATPKGKKHKKIIDETARDLSRILTDSKNRIDDTCGSKKFPRPSPHVSKTAESRAECR